MSQHDMIYLRDGGTPFKVYDPNDDRRTPAPTNRQLEPPSPELIAGTMIELEPVRWLWPQWLAKGKLHLVAGAPGTGKTTIALALAATITRGGSWPDGGCAEAGDVIMWSGEDDLADTLLPRFLVAGGDPRRLHFVGSMPDGGKARPFDPARDVPALAHAAKSLMAPKLIILDPVVTAVAGDSHKNAEARRGLQPVVDLGSQVGCAVLGVTHLSKGTAGRDPLERVTGSIAFGAVARVVLATVRPADRHAPRRLVRAKSNLGPDVGGIEYSLFAAPLPDRDFAAQRVDWGQVLAGTARELMQIEEPDEDAGKVKDGQTFLAGMLADGPVPTNELKAAAAAHGHSWRTLRRVQAKLGVKAVKLGLKQGWAWRLPEVDHTRPGPEGAHHE